MAILDIFKKKEEPKKAAKPVKKETEKKVTPVLAKVPKKHGKSEFIYGIVRKPHISEKATNLAEINQYIFEVYPKANKIEIKKNIEGIYGVDVLSVNIIKIPGKARRVGRTQGFKSGYKKAVVKIKEGQKIEII